MYSHSRISAFEHCPLKFRFKYIDRIKTEVPTTIEAFLGSRVHAALEKLYEDLQYERRASLPELLEYYRAGWEAEWEEGILIAKPGFSPENYRKAGERMLSDYYRRYAPFDQGRTIGIETKVVLLLPKGEQMIGYIDRLVDLGNGRYEIHDYKTNAGMKSQADLDKDRQLALYSIGIRQQFPDAKEVALVWHFLAFDKEMRSSRTEKQLDELASRTGELIKEIESAKDFPAREGPLCSYCEFQPVCPKRAHLFKLAKMPSNEYLKEPGAKLVEELAKLKAEAGTIDKKVEKVREALIAFAEREGIDNVSGWAHYARVRREETVSFPKKGDSARAEFLAVLKKLPTWKEIEDFDQFALRRLIREGTIDNSGLARYETSEERKIVTTGKLKK